MYFSHKVNNSFFIIPEDIDVDKYEKNHIVSDVYLYVSTEHHHFSSIDNNNGDKLFLMGYFHDIRDSGIKTDETLNQLLNYKSEKELYNHLDHLNGRYNLFIIRNGILKLYSDATNMLPTFYQRENKIIASHDYIIKQLLESIYEVLVEDEGVFNKNAADWAGTKGVIKLNPSLELAYPSFETKRIFPRKNRMELTVDEAVGQMDKYRKQIIDWLSKQNNLKFSLTGGVDSRITLAFLKPLVNQLDFFTYLKDERFFRSEYMKKSYQNDKDIVDSLQYNLNLNHKYFTIPQNEKMEPSFSDRMKETMSSSHSFQLSYYFMNNEDYKNALHIKSTVQSVGKSSFKTSLYNENTIENVLEGFKKWAPTVCKEKQNYQIYKKEMNAYLKRSKIDLTDMKGYHVLDLIFLESRLGNFQSKITQETDDVMDIYNPFNSRKMIALLLSVSLYDRQNQNIGKALIEKYWPVLSTFPQNEAPSLLDKQNYLISAIQNNNYYRLASQQLLVPGKVENLKIIEQNGKAIIEAEKVPLDPDSTYSCELINLNRSIKTHTLKSEYDNEKGRGTISTVINGVERDILDLNKGIKVRLDSDETLDIKIKVNEKKSKESWIKATRIVFE